MKILQQFTGGSKSKLPSIVVDPFTLNSVKCINIRYDKFWSTDPFTWKGSIEFSNGKTSGKQDLEPTPDFDNIILQIKTLLESVNK